MAARRDSARKRAQDAEFERCLAAARNGCTEAFGKLLQGCRRYLLLVANQELESSLRPKQGASDLVQETFVLAQRDFQSFRGSTFHELHAWLKTILQHQLLNQVRHYKQTQKRAVRREVSLNADEQLGHQELTDGQPVPGDAAVLGDDKRRLRLAMDRLPKHYREVLVRRTWQRESFPEIGHAMGRSTEAVEKIWMRAVERLQRELRSIS